MSTVAKTYIYNARFKGLPKKSDLKVVEESLPAIKDGGQLPTSLFRLWGHSFIVPPQMRFSILEKT